MKRQQIINELIEKNSYKSYLEVGVQNPSSCYNMIKCDNKQGIEPFPTAGIIQSPMEFFIGTSDDYFEVIKGTDTTFDIVFIDGLHHDDQVIKDINNSLEVLNEGGIIVCHDCLPANEHQQQRNDHGSVWLGDVWKAIAHFRITRNDLKIEVINSDLGCGLISKGTSETWDTNNDEWDNYEYYNRNKKELMNIISVSEFKEKYL